jgi:hypothetical protein
MEPVVSHVPQDRHVAFMTVCWAQGGGYLGGIVGGMVLVAIIFDGRLKKGRREEEKNGYPPEPSISSCRMIEAIKNTG